MIYTKCNFDGCLSLAAGAGFCTGHYSAYKAGKPLKPKKVNVAPKPCSIDTCDKAARTRGYCTRHYQQVLVGKIESDKELVLCEVAECNAIATSKNMCTNHAAKVRYLGIDCAIKNCDKPVVGKHGLCSGHSRKSNRFNLDAATLNELESRKVCDNKNCRSNEVLSIDHDHMCCSGQNSCGKCVRGKLCRSCNTALGYVQDDIKKLFGLIDYLESYKNGIA